MTEYVPFGVPELVAAMLAAISFSGTLIGLFFDDTVKVGRYFKVREKEVLTTTRASSWPRAHAPCCLHCLLALSSSRMSRGWRN
jgi:hypothetical protein